MTDSVGCLEIFCYICTLKGNKLSVVPNGKLGVSSNHAPPATVIFLFNFFFSFFNRQNISLVKTLNFDPPVSVLCHLGVFGCGDGGWTPVMKINGNKVGCLETTSDLADKSRFPITAPRNSIPF